MAINLSGLITDIFATLNSSNAADDLRNSSPSDITGSHPGSDFAGYLQDFSNLMGDNGNNVMSSGNELTLQPNTTIQNNLNEIGMRNLLNEDLGNEEFELDANLYPSNTNSDNIFTIPIDIMANFLQTSFQVQQIETLSSTIANLQTSLDEYEGFADTANSEFAQQRVDRMVDNITMLDSYLTSKVSELTTEESLLSSLNASSSLTRYLLTRE